MGGRQGKLVVISGPSGSGKTTICRRLVERNGYRLSVSDTTRPPRPGESDGVEYHFLDRERFEHRIREGAYLEYAEVYGNLYGTPRKPIEEAIEEGATILLNIDPQGARKVRRAGLEGLYIFLLPPSKEELRRRLEARRSDTPEVVARRLARACEEIEVARREEGLYDHLVVNDDLEETVERIERLIEASDEKE